MKRKREPDASGGMTLLPGGRQLRMARAMVGGQQHVPTSAELKLARHMAQDGASWQQIQDALGWTCTHQTTRIRLSKFNIFIRGGMNVRDGKRAKFGGLTTLSNGGGNIETRSYRPRQIRAAR
jgi:hypothetical protein